MLLNFHDFLNYFSGWRPRRTIIFAHWDGEEQSIAGSYEWVQVSTRADECEYKSMESIILCL